MKGYIQVEFEQDKIEEILPLVDNAGKTIWVKEISFSELMMEYPQYCYDCGYDPFNKDTVQNFLIEKQIIQL